MKYTITFLALACYAWAAPSAKQDDIKIIKLNKIETAREKMVKSGDMAQFKRQLNKQKALKAMGQEFDQSVLDLESYLDAAYTWNIGVGTPAQPFSAIFDTSSPWLWIPDNKCTNHGFGRCDSFCHSSRSWCTTYPTHCDGCSECRGGNEEIQAPPSGCENKRKFDTSRSRSFGSINHDNTKFDVSPNSIDKVEGFVGYDTVELFGIQSRQYIELATEVGDFWNQIDADGVLGCGFPAFEPKSGLYIRPYLENAYMQHHLGSDTFSVYMNPQGGNAISIGGANAQWYQPGTLHYHNVPSNSKYWTLNVDKFWVGQSTFVKAGRALVSTTANYIGAPHHDVQEIAATVGTIGFDNNMEMFKVLCNYPLKDVALFIDGLIYTLSYQDYVIQASNGQCYLGFKVISGMAEQYVLGAPFFNAYYAIFEFRSSQNQPRIGLAQHM